MMIMDTAYISVSLPSYKAPVSSLSLLACDMLWSLCLLRRHFYGNARPLTLLQHMPSSLSFSMQKRAARKERKKLARQGGRDAAADAGRTGSKWYEIT